MNGGNNREEEASGDSLVEDVNVRDKEVVEEKEGGKKRTREEMEEEEELEEGMKEMEQKRMRKDQEEEEVNGEEKEKEMEREEEKMEMEEEEGIEKEEKKEEKERKEEEEKEEEKKEEEKVQSVPVDVPDEAPKKKEKSEQKEAEKEKKKRENVEKEEEQPTKKRARGRPPKAKTATKTEERVKMDFALSKEGFEGGVVLTLGQGDTGQLGLGEDIMERAKPAMVKALGEEIMEICAGGMHSVCINKKGEVFTFGCNDEGALGRTTEDDEETYTPGKVEIPGKVVQVSAGDSHTVALTEDGKAFYWGTFRDNSGSFGLTTDGIVKLPIPLAPQLKIKKIASGSDHVALLTADGKLYTVGCAEQGQLGRVGERFASRGGRRGLSLLLTPDLAQAKSRRIVFTDVWAGSYSTYAQAANNEIHVCGLNNYNQLGIAKGQIIYTLTKSPSFTTISQEVGGWNSITPGQHHALGLDNKGHVYAIGRVEYGRLGLGEDVKEDATVPTLIPKLQNEKAMAIGCGSVVSFAVTDNGIIHSWGMGTNGQLGHEDDSDASVPCKMLGKQLEGRKVFRSAGGGQHTMLLASNAN